jgi:hypothetical protein
MHHAFPRQLDLQWYRAQAHALLRDVHRADPEAQRRVADAVGSRPALKLADTQRTIAREHGFAHWADFKHWVETRHPEPPVGRIGREPVAAYDQRARGLIEQVTRGEVDGLRRVRAWVPRLSTFHDTHLALPEARLVIAREYGFPTWRDLVQHVDKATPRLRASAERAAEPGGYDRPRTARPVMLHCARWPAN